MIRFPRITKYFKLVDFHSIGQKTFSVEIQHKSRKELRRMKEKEHLVVVENIIEGKTGKWETRIGLEVHAQIKSDKKLFSGNFVDSFVLLICEAPLSNKPAYQIVKFHLWT